MLLMGGSTDKRSGSVERDSRNADRDSSSVMSRGGGERGTRIGDWSEHVSSSGKKYYYNCKTEVSQWEKPREWLDKERTMGSASGSASKEPHHSSSRGNDYRSDKDRDRSSRDDRFSRSSEYERGPFLALHSDSLCP